MSTRSPSARQGSMSPETTGFAQCLRHCAATPSFVAEFDRLTGSNLSMRGSPLELEIDRATGRTDAELKRFVAFVREVVWNTLPDAALSALASVASDHPQPDGEA